MLSQNDKDMIDLIIKRFRENHEGEWNLWLEGMKQRRKEVQDEKFGETGNQTMRAVGNLPEKLHIQIRLYKQDFLEGENALQFFRAFPVFKVSNKI